MPRPGRATVDRPAAGCRRAESAADAKDDALPKETRLSMPRRSMCRSKRPRSSWTSRSRRRSTTVVRPLPARSERTTGERDGRLPRADRRRLGRPRSRRSSGKTGDGGERRTPRQSEEAVERGLRWLAAHQRDDGSWCFDLEKPPCNGMCRNSGSEASTTAATGLALLPFLGAGYTQTARRTPGDREDGDCTT